jgi:predicted Zn-dependent protease
LVVETASPGDNIESGLHIATTLGCSMADRSSRSRGEFSVFSSHIAFSNRRLSILAVVVCFSCLPRIAMSAPQRARQMQIPFWQNPGEILDRLFGPEDEIDAQLLDKVHVSSAEEAKMGKRAVETYLQMMKQKKLQVITRGREVRYLSELVQIVHPLMKQHRRYRNIKVYYLVTEEIEARSFPGGYLVFSQGLLNFAENEAALIGIVAHELAHFDRGHHTRRVQRVKYMQQTLATGRKFNQLEDMFEVGSVFLRTWVRPFQSDLEQEADQDGARWSYQAGYDCREMAKLLLHYEDRHGRIPIPDFFRSHPSGKVRYRLIMDEYEQLQRETPNPALHIGKRNLEQRAVVGKQ